MHTYAVIFNREQEGGYHVYCPALVGCHSEGETFEEALYNIQEAISAYIESLESHHEPIPEEDVVIKQVRVNV